jgi:hypothetical protein
LPSVDQYFAGVALRHKGLINLRLVRLVFAINKAGFDVALVGFSDADMERLLGLTDGGDGGGGATADKPDPGINYQEKFAVLVDCKDEAHQAQVYEALMAKGYACKVLVN